MPSLRDIAFARESLLACAGYLPEFIDPGVQVKIDHILAPEMKQVLPDVEGNKKGVLNYTNLSVLYHGDRRVPFLSAYNIDGKKRTSKVKRAPKFLADPRIDEDIQLNQAFYDLRKDITEFEIGHMAANNEMAWGKDAQIKAYQTFHFPNSVPQAEKLNTGIWKMLETYIIDEAISLKKNKRICVFTGPLLRQDDPAYSEDPNFNIPLLFYKVVVFPTPAGLRSTAFIMSHEERMREQGMFLMRRDVMIESGEGVGLPAFHDFRYRKVFQVNLGLLEDFSGLRFRWRGVRRISVPDDKQQIMKIRKVTNAADAKAASRGLFAPEMLVDEELTSREMQTGNFALNIKLQ